MKKIFIALLAIAALFAACDYGNRNFVYPTPLPVVLSGTPIAVLVPTPAPTATPQPTATPANTATPQPTGTPSRVSRVGSSTGSTTSTSPTTATIDIGSGGFQLNTTLRLTISLRCDSQNCGDVVFQNSINNTDIIASFESPLGVDLTYLGQCQVTRSNIAAGLFQARCEWTNSTPDEGTQLNITGQGINWSDNWDFVMAFSGVTSGATLYWIVNVEKIGD